MKQSAGRLATTLLALASAAAQQRFTASDYARAEKLMGYNTTPLVLRSGVRPTWLPDGRFWYRVTTTEGAEFVLVGGSRSAQLFAGDPALSFKETGYSRAGSTIERLLSWVDLIECVRELTQGLQPAEYLIVDPDTRLTQLGMLPLTRAFEERSGRPPAVTKQTWSDYLFFPSREYGEGTSNSLSELTGAWLDQVFGETVRTYPWVRPSDEDLDAACRLVKGLRRPIITMNFGVGENQLKRIGGDFEASLVAHLIRKGATIILDKGAGEEEMVSHGEQGDPRRQSRA